MAISFPLLQAISALTKVMEDCLITAKGAENYMSVLKIASMRLKKKPNHPQTKKTKHEPPQNFLQTLEA